MRGSPRSSLPEAKPSNMPRQTCGLPLMEANSEAAAGRVRETPQWHTSVDEALAVQSREGLYHSP